MFYFFYAFIVRYTKKFYKLIALYTKRCYYVIVQYTEKEEIMKQQTYCELCSLETSNKILIDEIKKSNAEFTQRKEFILKNKYMSRI